MEFDDILMYLLKIEVQDILIKEVWGLNANLRILLRIKIRLRKLGNNFFRG